MVTVQQVQGFLPKECSGADWVALIERAIEYQAEDGATRFPLTPDQLAFNFADDDAPSTGVEAMESYTALRLWEVSEVRALVGDCVGTAEFIHRQWLAAAKQMVIGAVLSAVEAIETKGEGR